MSRRADRHPASRRSLLSRAASGVDRAAVAVRGAVDQRRHSVPWAGLTVAVVLVVFLLARQPLRSVLTNHPAVDTWLTVFVALCLQALPFLVAAALVSAALDAWVWPRVVDGVTRRLTGSSWLAAPLGALLGAILMRGEQSVVRAADDLARRGASPAAVVAFLIASPALNPVVLVATLAAFPDHPSVTVVRAGATAATAVAVGVLWGRFGGPIPVRRRRPTDDEPALDRFTALSRRDLLRSGGYLVVAAALAALVDVLAPGHIIDGLLVPAVAVILLGLFAVVVSAPAVTTAFIATALARFPMAGLLALMVGGATSSLRVVSVEAIVWDRRFAGRLAVPVLVVGVGLAAVLAGLVR